MFPSVGAADGGAVRRDEPGDPREARHHHDQDSLPLHSAPVTGTKLGHGEMCLFHHSLSRVKNSTRTFCCGSPRWNLPNGRDILMPWRICCCSVTISPALSPRYALPQRRSIGLRRKRRVVFVECYQEKSIFWKVYRWSKTEW